MAALNQNAPPEMVESEPKPRPRKKEDPEQNKAVIQALHMGSPGFDKSMALDGQSAMLPIEQKGNITNFFNKDGEVDIQTQNETFQDAPPDMGKSNKSLHLGMQQSVHNKRKFVESFKSNPMEESFNMRSMDSGTAKQMQPSSNNTLDFIEKINQVGKGDSIKKPEFYMQEETKKDDKMDLTV